HVFRLDPGKTRYALLDGCDDFNALDRVNPKISFDIHRQFDHLPGITGLLANDVEDDALLCRAFNLDRDYWRNVRDRRRNCADRNRLCSKWLQRSGCDQRLRGQNRRFWSRRLNRGNRCARCWGRKAKTARKQTMLILHHLLNEPMSLLLALKK